MNQALRKLTAKAGKNNVALVFINQLREMLGCVGENTKVFWTK